VSNQANRKRRRDAIKRREVPQPPVTISSQEWDTLDGIYEGTWTPSTPKYVQWHEEYADRFATVDDVRASLQLGPKEKIHWIIKQSKLYMDWVKQVQTYQRKVIDRAKKQGRNDIPEYALKLTHRYYSRHKDQYDAAEAARTIYNIPDRLKDTGDWGQAITPQWIPKEDN